MKRVVKIAVFSLLLGAMAVLTASASTRPTVFVSILPQKFFVQQISGDLVNVEVMVPPGASPHTYEPKPSQMRKLAEASIFFTIGIELEEAWLDRISEINPDMKVIHTEAGIDKMAMSARHHHEEEEHDDDQREGDGTHADRQGHDEEAEDGLDPHIWLAPALVTQQARIIGDSLVTLDAGNGDAYRANLTSFLQDIGRLDAQLRSLLAPREGMKFMVFHPSWGYFAQSYGLEQVPVEVEGKNPKPAHLKELIELGRHEKISVIFAQPQFSQKSAEVIAREIGAQVVLIDPLAEDWFANMSMVAEKMAAALR